MTQVCFSFSRPNCFLCLSRDREPLMRFSFSLNIKPSSHSSACVIEHSNWFCCGRKCVLQILWGRTAGGQSPSDGVEQHLPSKTEKVDPYKRKTDTFRIFYLSRCIMYWVLFSVSFKPII